jgi:hypothetical protein
MHCIPLWLILIGQDINRELYNQRLYDAFHSSLKITSSNLPIMNPVPIEYRSLIGYNHEWHALICFKCEGHSAIGRSSLVRHLRGLHGLNSKDYKPLIQALDESGVSFLQSLEDFPRPMNDSIPIDELSILKGLECNQCGFLSTSASVMRKHIYNEKMKFQKENPTVEQDSHPGVAPTSLQTWSTYGWKGGYWTVIDPNASFEIPLVIESPVDKTSLSWMEQMIETEEQRLKTLDDYMFRRTQRSEKDDTSTWLTRTGWSTLFVERDRIMISNSCLFTTDDKLVHELFKIRQTDLLILSRAMDRIIEWGMDTLNSTPWGLRCWLRSPKRNEPDRRPFRKPQESSTVVKYTRYWKQFIYYCFRTAELESDKRKHLYGIEFTNEQERMIQEITLLLRQLDVDGECDDDELNEDEDYEQESDSDEEEDDSNQTLLADGVSNEYNPIDRISENLFRLCISFLTQRFQLGEAPHSPLLHFSGVLGIDRANKRFRRPSNYTPILAGLIWVGRLLLLEYAIPKREYVFLRWPSRQTYEDHGWRLEDIRRGHMIEGTYSPMSNLVALLAYGKCVAKTEDRPGLVIWDNDNMGLMIKDIHITVDEFRGFIHKVIESSEKLMSDVLMFGLDLPKIDISSLKDCMTTEEVGFSLMKDKLNGLVEGYRYMLNISQLASPEKRLLKGDGEWDSKKVLEYLNKKKRFLELLMLAVHLTGGQPARGPEIGSIKFRNSSLTLRNIFVIRGNTYFVIEYHKARAVTNHSYFIVRCLPPGLAELLIVYLAYIRPFCNLLYSQISFRQNHSDGDYLFCSEENPDEPWEGRKLSEILQRESQVHLQVKINMWAYRHIAVQMTRMHVKEIYPYFEKDDSLWEAMLSRNKDYNIYAWQTGHQRSTNISTYGLDRAFPSRLQPELINEYIRISRIWHRWLGLWNGMVIAKVEGRSNVDQELEKSGDRDLETPKRKRQKTIQHDEIVETNNMSSNASPESNKLLKMQQDIARMIECRKTERLLREKYNMLV